MEVQMHAEVIQRELAVTIWICLRTSDMCRCLSHDPTYDCGRHAATRAIKSCWYGGMLQEMQAQTSLGNKLLAQPQQPQSKVVLPTIRRRWGWRGSLGRERYLWTTRANWRHHASRSVLRAPYLLRRALGQTTSWTVSCRTYMSQTESQTCRQCSKCNLCRSVSPNVSECKELLVLGMDGSKTGRSCMEQQMFLPRGAWPRAPIHRSRIRARQLFQNCTARVSRQRHQRSPTYDIFGAQDLLCATDNQTHRHGKQNRGMEMRPWSLEQTELVHRLNGLSTGSQKRTQKDTLYMFSRQHKRRSCASGTGVDGDPGTSPRIFL